MTLVSAKHGYLNALLLLGLCRLVPGEVVCQNDVEGRTHWHSTQRETAGSDWRTYATTFIRQNDAGQPCIVT